MSTEQAQVDERGVSDSRVNERSVLAELSEVLHELLEDYGLDDVEITMDTKFHDDLELESIDLVGLSGQLRERYGDKVNFAAFIADKELEEIIDLTVGQLVRYVVDSLNTKEQG